MKTRVELWVRLKVIDLVTQTARMTLEEKLGFGESLRGITHYWYWSMDADGKDAKSIIDGIDRTVRLDSSFTNQNKHFYRILADGKPVRGDLDLERDYPGPDIPALRPGADTRPEMSGARRPLPKGAIAGMSGPEMFAFDCLVREKRRDREVGYADRLNSRLKGVKVSDMKYGEVWRITVSAASKGNALADVERMLVSRSRREGLLLNPHYQEYEIIAAPKRAGTAQAKPARTRTARKKR